jgi:Mor family transcriptional regulator
MQTEAIIKHNNQIYKKYLTGITRAEVAKEHNLSNERICQICNRLKGQLSKKIASTFKPTK